MTQLVDELKLRYADRIVLLALSEQIGFRLPVGFRSLLRCEIRSNISTVRLR